MMQLESRECSACGQVVGHLPLDYMCLHCRLKLAAQDEKKACLHCHHPRLWHIDGPRHGCVVCTCLGFYTLDQAALNYANFRRYHH